MINTIIKGDCLEVMKSIETGSIDMILADLPYATTACSWDVIIPFKELWEQYERIIKKNGAIVLTASQPFTTDLIMSNRKLFKYELIWKKNRYTNFMQAKRQAMRNHENILIFYKAQPTFNPQRVPVQQRGSGKRNNVERDVIYQAKGEASKNYTGKRADDCLGNPGSVLDFKSVQKTIHPTQKPVPLFEYLIKIYTNEGDVVLDNVSGSGTTAIACLNTNRKYICIEQDETYYTKSIERIEEHKRTMSNKIF
jgi:site-specific DNA-methyltransferase (adenine-specific)